MSKTEAQVVTWEGGREGEGDAGKEGTDGEMKVRKGWKKEGITSRGCQLVTDGRGKGKRRREDEEREKEEERK